MKNSHPKPASNSQRGRFMLQKEYHFGRIETNKNLAIIPPATSPQDSHSKAHRDNSTDLRWTSWTTQMTTSLQSKMRSMMPPLCPTSHRAWIWNWETETMRASTMDICPAAPVKILAIRMRHRRLIPTRMIMTPWKNCIRPITLTRPNCQPKKRMKTPSV